MSDTRLLSAYRAADEVTHDQIFDATVEVVNALRDDNPVLTLRTLTEMCTSHPTRMAQLMMALAASVPADDTVTTLARRHELVAREGIRAMNHRMGVVA